MDAVVAASGAASVVNYLDKHTGAVQAVATVVLVGVTAYYAILTRHIAKSAREAQRPYVYVEVVAPEAGSPEFTIGNTGIRAAQDVRLSAKVIGDDTLAESVAGLVPVKGGIAYLSPGRLYRYWIRADNSVFDSKREPHVVIEFHLSYRDGDRRYKETVHLDLSAMDSVLFSSFRSAADIAAPLRELVGIERRRSSQRPIERSLRSPRKACRACSSLIETSAKKCPMCLEWQDDAEAQEGVPPKPSPESPDDPTAA